MVPSIYGEKMFDDFFDNGFFGGHSPLFGKHARNLMKTDIRETDDAKAYRFAVELPGFQKDEIHVDVQDGYLTVSAVKAKYESGVLTVLIPKEEPKKLASGSSITIE